MGIKNSDGTCSVIYTHWDGYPSHHLPILREHYNTVQKVLELIELGDISELKETTETTVAYHRDRNEDYNPPRNICYPLLKIEIPNNIEYVYIWNGAKLEIRGKL